MFTHKKRSAHGIYSSTQSAPIPPDTVKASSMGSVGEHAPTYYVDSVIAGASPDVDAKVQGELDGPVNHEPLVMDFAAMHDEHSINAPNAPFATPSSRADGSWLSDDDTAAAPPDFSRRDISHHIPLRTR
jgi:hypothetical protein